MTQDERLNYLVKKFKEDSDQYKNLIVGDSVEEKKQILRSLMNIRMPKKIGDETLGVQDAYLQERAKEKGIVSLADIKTVAQEYGSNHPFADRISITNAYLY